MKLRLVPRAALKARVSPRLAASIVEGVGIDVAESGGVYTVRLDFASLTEQPSISAAERDNLFLGVYDSDGDFYRKIDLDTLLTAISAGLDPTLVAIAGLSPTADQSIYFDGADTAAVYTLTSQARALLDDTSFAAMRGTLELATSTTDNGIPRYNGTTGGQQTSLWLIDDSGNLCPITNDTGALGTASLRISDAFFASGAVVNFAGGVTLTDGSSLLTMAGGVLVLPNAGLQVGSSVPFSDSAGTLTLQNVDVLDATTEATIEAAIDTLANLTSVQGRTVTLADAGFDVLFGWDDSASAYKNFALADITSEAAPASGDYFLLYGAEGDLRKVNFDDMPAGSGGGRELLTGARTYYVRTDGSDSNTGLVDSSGGAFLTVQKAIDTVATLDLSIYDVTIQIGNGTYTGTNTLKSLIGAGKCIIVGDETTPSNVLISTTSANCFTGETFQGIYEYRGMKLQTTTSGTCITCNCAGGIVRFRTLDFGASASHHINAGRMGTIMCVGTAYTISGGTAGAHISASYNGLVQWQGAGAAITVTLSGTPAFTGGCVSASVGGVIRADNISFVGSATGKRYNVIGNSTVHTNGGGASYFPGDVAGTTTADGEYT